MNCVMAGCPNEIGKQEPSVEYCLDCLLGIYDRKGKMRQEREQLYRSYRFRESRKDQYNYVAIVYSIRMDKR
jgi:hypothetical protein